MTVAWRRDLESWLGGFVSTHNGTRLGRMFGVPAAYAGRRLFSCVIENGVIARLPAAAFDRALAAGGERWTPKGRRMTGWVIFRPKTPLEADAIGPFLEIAARHVAEARNEPTGRPGATHRPTSTPPKGESRRAKGKQRKANRGSSRETR